MSKPTWFDGLTHKDWLFDGRPIRDSDTLRQYHDLNWDNARVDMGPSPTGNLGPYWHVPRIKGDTTHRLYPKVLKGKWLNVIRRAVEELASETRSH